MPISVDDLSEFAVKVSESPGSNETALRASSSRAYYAAFHALLPMVMRLPRSTKHRAGSNHITHEDFVTRLSELSRGVVSDPDLVALQARAGQLCRTVDACRASRVKADYKLTTEFHAGEAAAQVRRALLVLRAVREATAPPGGACGTVPASQSSR